MEVESSEQGGALFASSTSLTFSMVKGRMVRCRSTGSSSGSFYLSVGSIGISMSCISSSRSASDYDAGYSLVPDDANCKVAFNESGIFLSPPEMKSGSYPFNPRRGVQTIRLDNFSHSMLESGSGNQYDLYYPGSLIELCFYGHNQIGGYLIFLDDYTSGTRIQTIERYNFVNNSEVSSEKYFIYVCCGCPSFIKCVFADNQYTNLITGKHDGYFSESFFCSNLFSNSASATGGQGCSPLNSMNLVEDEGCILKTGLFSERKLRKVLGGSFASVIISE